MFVLAVQRLCIIKEMEEEKRHMRSLILFMF